MRIAFFIHQFPPERFGGAERHAFQLATALSASHEVFVYTPSVGQEIGAPIEEMVGRVCIRRFRDRRISAQSALAADLIRALDDFRPDILHVHHAIGIPPSAVLRLVRRYPSVITFHDYWWLCPQIRLLFKGETTCVGPKPLSRCSACFAGPPANSLIGEAGSFLETGPFAGLIRSRRLRMNDFSNHAQNSEKDFLLFLLAKIETVRRLFFFRRRSLYKEILASADALISPSHYLFERYREAGYLSPRLPQHVLPYGVDPVEAGPRSNGPVRLPIRFALVGHLNREKGLLLALRAFRDISPEEASLDLYGDIDPPSVVSGFSNLENIRFHGPFSPSSAPEIWKSIDVLIVPSLWVENAPKVIHEAFASGVPVIASNHGAMPEFVGKQSGGRLFDPQDAISLENLIRNLVKNPAEIDAFRKTLPPVETTASIAERTVEIYNNILSNNRKINNSRTSL